LRYSGSGEATEAHVPALAAVAEQGVHLWGFTRRLNVAESLVECGIAVIVSCDGTTDPGFIRDARRRGLQLAYSSNGVDDHPPAGTIVTFPVHRVGRVREVVDDVSLCPKVVADFLHDERPPASCQAVCRRCHNPAP
jgi:hypothetical protein